MVPNNIFLEEMYLPAHKMYYGNDIAQVRNALVLGMGAIQFIET